MRARHATSARSTMGSTGHDGCLLRAWFSGSRCPAIAPSLASRSYSRASCEIRGATGLTSDDDRRGLRIRGGRHGGCPRALSMTWSASCLRLVGVSRRIADLVVRHLDAGLVGDGLEWELSRDGKGRPRRAGAVRAAAASGSRPRGRSRARSRGAPASERARSGARPAPGLDERQARLDTAARNRVSTSSSISACGPLLDVGAQLSPSVSNSLTARASSSSSGGSTFSFSSFLQRDLDLRRLTVGELGRDLLRGVRPDSPTSACRTPRRRARARARSRSRASRSRRPQRGRDERVAFRRRGRPGTSWRGTCRPRSAGRPVPVARRHRRHRPRSAPVATSTSVTSTVAVKLRPAPGSGSV